eukprot:jgi/Botrbrau1/10593/Bobra.0358s0013.1
MTDASAELPIDVNYGKLEQWLVERRQLPKDWRKRVNAIQGKVAVAATQLPAEVLRDVLGDAEAQLDYQAVKAVRDKLAETAEKTLFGGVAGPAGVWDKLCKAYEKENVYLGEAAQLMVSQVDYDIPALSKAAAKSQSQLADMERRAADHLRSAAAAAKDFQQECQQLEVAGPDHVANLRHLPAQLPPIVLGAAQKLQDPELEDLLNHYADFIAFAHGGKGNSRPSVPELLPVISEVRQAVLKLPTRRETEASPEPGGDSPAAGGTVGDSSAPTIDWGVDMEVVPEGGGEEAPAIQWDLDEADLALGETEDAAGPAPDGSVAEGSSTAPLEVQWEIGLDNGEAGADWEISVGESGLEAGQVTQAQDSSSPEAEDEAGVVERVVGGCSVSGTAAG